MRFAVLNLSKYFPALLDAVTWRPRGIVIALTPKCNCRCLTCNYWKFQDARELETEEVKGILAQAARLGIRDCVFYGGEPLLRRDLPELVGSAHAQGMKTKIMTNGMLADDEKAGSLAREGLDGVHISLDACGKALDDMRGVEGAFEKTLSGIESFIRVRKGGRPRVVIAALLMLPTLQERRLLEVLNVARKLDVSVMIQLITFSFFYYQIEQPDLRQRLWIDQPHWQDLDGLVDELVVLKKESPSLILNSPASLKYIKVYFRDPRDKRLPCYRAYSGKVWVGSDGKVYLCQALPPVGSLREQDLAGIVASTGWRDGVKRMFRKECPGCSCDYSSNVDADLSYAWAEVFSRF